RAAGEPDARAPRLLAVPVVRPAGARPAPARARYAGARGAAGGGRRRAAGGLRQGGLARGNVLGAALVDGRVADLPVDARAGAAPAAAARARGAGGDDGRLDRRPG